MPDQPSEIEAAPGREIVSGRLIPATRVAVFNAFADPTRLTQWWGPNGFTNTIHAFDLRAGGRWRLTMRGPDGTAFQNESEFTDVVRPERIVFQHLEPVHRFQMTMLFDDRGGKTELTWRMLFESVSECAKFQKLIIDANEQNFDRLAAHLTRCA